MLLIPVRKQKIKLAILFPIDTNLFINIAVFSFVEPCKTVTKISGSHSVFLTRVSLFLW